MGLWTKAHLSLAQLGIPGVAQVSQPAVPPTSSWLAQARGGKPGVRRVCGLEIGDPADWMSALQHRPEAPCKKNQMCPLDEALATPIFQSACCSSRRLENRRHGSRLAEAEEFGGARKQQLHAAVRCGDGGGCLRILTVPKRRRGWVALESGESASIRRVFAIQFRHGTNGSQGSDISGSCRLGYSATSSDDAPGAVIGRPPTPGACVRAPSKGHARMPRDQFNSASRPTGLTC